MSDRRLSQAATQVTVVQVALPRVDAVSQERLEDSVAHPRRQQHATDRIGVTTALASIAH
jgi:hypothetical protein